MKKLLIATTNPSKKQEITQGLALLIEQGLTVMTLSDVTITGEPVESGDTFEQNAQIKAQFYADQTGLPSLADDGGLLIDALNGEPGVKSRRWPGYEATDQELIDYALDKLKDIPEGKRHAQLVTYVCLYNPVDQTFHGHQEAIEGYITTTPLTYDTNGYPYRALFKVKQYDKFYDHLTDEEHHAMNHRLKAIKKLIPTIETLLFS